MKIVKKSFWKTPEVDAQKFELWVRELEKLNGYAYDQATVPTSLGNTKVYGLNTDKTEWKTLVIFPGYRTTSLIWDLDQGLAVLARHYRIFLVETNGQPNLSDGSTPAIKSLGYGEWGKEVFDGLGIQKAAIVGASFGGLVCMKISICIPERVTAAILLNPGCFRFVSLSFKNLYYNLLPIFRPTAKNILKFLDQIVFHKPFHQISDAAEQLLIEYLKLAIQCYKDNTQKPYSMREQLYEVTTDIYMIVGNHDILIPFEKSVANAKKYLGSHLKEVFLETAGHGIELYPQAIQRIHEILTS